ncbi:hypothetical protein RCL_jg13965.t1 [Rhizophagus clarus]|uniref:Uncharacterized protein n=1 Tax=Rhizophagus clarus TaxID=94130 RepID=A0A8H3LTQ8_9GLOM|nr:hypothetical protein RCL_jg13965.t1 [Rhizophagus clarus]
MIRRNLTYIFYPKETEDDIHSSNTFDEVKPVTTPISNFPAIKTELISQSAQAYIGALIHHLTRAHLEGLDIVIVFHLYFVPETDLMKLGSSTYSLHVDEFDSTTGSLDSQQDVQKITVGTSLPSVPWYQIKHLKKIYKEIADKALLKQQGKASEEKPRVRRASKLIQEAR